MVDDLLVIPEIESFRLQLNMTELDLTKLLEVSVAYANYNDTKFKINTARILLPVKADKDRLIQVLINLLDNAVKYNKKIMRQLWFLLQILKINPCLSILNKSDIIPEDKLETLFDKFVRLDSELTRTTRGTGLGLYIVKGLCDAMNISIDVSSTEEGFEVVLVFNNEKPKNETVPEVENILPNDERILLASQKTWN